jgi:hypothetical protein
MKLKEVVFQAFADRVVDQGWRRVEQCAAFTSDMRGFRPMGSVADLSTYPPNVTTVVESSQEGAAYPDAGRSPSTAMRILPFPLRPAAA